MVVEGEPKVCWIAIKTAIKLLKSPLKNFFTLKPSRWGIQKQGILLVVFHYLFVKHRIFFHRLPPPKIKPPKTCKNTKVPPRRGSVEDPWNATSRNQINHQWAARHPKSHPPNHITKLDWFMWRPWIRVWLDSRKKNSQWGYAYTKGPFSIVQKKHTGQCFIPTYLPLQPVHSKIMFLKKINKPKSSNLRICIKGFTNRSVIFIWHQPNPLSLHSGVKSLKN